MNTVLIREATVSDAEGIAQIHVTSWQSAYRGQIPDTYLDSLSVEKRTALWKQILGEKQSTGRVLVAEEEGQLTGFMSVGPSHEKDTTPEVGKLHAIYLAPSRMGQGIGTALMEAGLTALRDMGFAEAILWVLTSNEKARRFYEKHGWSADGHTLIDETEERALHESRYHIRLS